MNEKNKRRAANKIKSEFVSGIRIFLWILFFICNFLNDWITVPLLSWMFLWTSICQGQKKPLLLLFAIERSCFYQIKQIMLILMWIWSSIILESKKCEQVVDRVRYGLIVMMKISRLLPIETKKPSDSKNFTRSSFWGVEIYPDDQPEARVGLL